MRAARARTLGAKVYLIFQYGPPQMANPGHQVLNSAGQLRIGELIELIGLAGPGVLRIAGD